MSEWKSYANRRYATFSGVDIHAVFYNKPIGTLQAVSYSITREIAPIYVLGFADLRSLSKGKRGIAGAMIFVNFDAHAMLYLLGGDREFYHYEHKTNPQIEGLDLRDGTNDTYKAPDVTQNMWPTGTDQALDAISTTVGAEQTMSADFDFRPPQYADQLPPFDITLAACNEMGSRAKMHIYGVQPMNEGSGFSIDDLVSEQQITYIAQAVYPWSRVTPMPGYTDQSVSG